MVEVTSGKIEDRSSNNSGEFGIPQRLACGLVLPPAT